MLHVSGGDELAFFNVDGAARFCGGDEQVGLAAEEGGDLQDEFGGGDGVGYAGAVVWGVDVGEDGEAGFGGYFFEDAAAFGEAGAAEALNAGAVGFVVAGFEDVRDVEVCGDALDGGGEGEAVGF